MRDDFITAYFRYIGESESPATFHRWSCLSILGAFLGRNYHFKLGHFLVHPNIYVMLMGSPGTRKTTAIKIATSLLKQAGYTNIAADKTSKEKFLQDLAGETSEHDGAKTNGYDILEQNLFGSEAQEAEILIAADEFNTFVGNGNIEFLSMLGVLWDYEGVFKNRLKNSKSIEIHNPTVSILAGNTPTGFSLAFPSEAIGQGIFSRLILVHGESPGRKIPFPIPPDPEQTAELVQLLHAIKAISKGGAELSPPAKKLLEVIYRTFKGVPDVRFDSYANRRFTHLLKLCLLLSAAALRKTIEETDVIYANTILSHTEHSMPKALGEFGKAKHSDVAHKLIQILEMAPSVVSIKELWKQLHNDLEDINTLKDMLGNLVIAEKIISTKGGFLAKRKVLEEQDTGLVDFSLLSDEERKYVL